VKIDRELVWLKCNKRCGYCGNEITLKQMQIDHIVPVFRGWKDEELDRYNLTRGTDDFDNLLPTCARCNKWKSTHKLEQFRKEIELQLERLRRDSPGYRLALDYGLIKENEKKVVFYFEK
jgi:5-methylcytosine-specific restriction endonuclease McrA